MSFRDAVKYGHDEFTSIKEDYRLNCGEVGYRKDLIMK